MIVSQEIDKKSEKKKTLYFKRDSNYNLEI